MQQVELYPLVQREVQRLLSGYLKTDQIIPHIERCSVAPALGNRSEVLGTLAVAAVAESQSVVA